MQPLRVLVAGGGIAAAELLLALRALAEERVELELIGPRPDLHLRATATAAPLGGGVATYDLRDLAADAGATFRADSVEAVAPAAHRVRLASGAVASYDAAVLATGARPRVAVPGAITFRDQRDSAPIEELLARGSGRVVFAAPPGVTWSLPLYELALLVAAQGLDAAIVTPEREPLEVFGRAVSAEIARLLADAGVAFMGATAPRAVARGSLELAYGGALPADAVVAVPRLVGRRISGVPADWNGFVRTDAHGRVEDVHDVFAVGDMTAFPVKQGGLAAQQAEVVARLLARRAGAPVPDGPVRHVLRTRLFGAPGPLFLHAELGPDGTAVSGATSTEAPWWPGAKVFGRHLTPWMAVRRTANAA